MRKNLNIPRGKAMCIADAVLLISEAFNISEHTALKCLRGINDPTEITSFSDLQSTLSSSSLDILVQAPHKYGREWGYALVKVVFMDVLEKGNFIVVDLYCLTDLEYVVTVKVLCGQIYSMSPRSRASHLLPNRAVLETTVRIGQHVLCEGNLYHNPNLDKAVLYFFNEPFHNKQGVVAFVTGK